MHQWGGAVRAALALVLALSVVGCSGDKDADDAKPNGIEDMSVGEAIRAVDAAMDDLDDIWVEGKGFVASNAGVVRAEGTAIVTKGACSVTVSTKAAGMIRVKVIGRSMYVTADPKAMTTEFGVPASTAARLRGTWIKGPVSPDLVRDCGLFDPVDRKTCKRGKEGTVGTVPTVAIKCTVDGHPRTIHVSAVGEPLVLLVTGTDRTGRFETRMVDHDTGIEVDAPPQGDVIAVPR